MSVNCYEELFDFRVKNAIYHQVHTLIMGDFDIPQYCDQLAGSGVPIKTLTGSCIPLNEFLIYNNLNQHNFMLC